jgi:acyl-CoA thioester hydrolase
MTDVELSIQVRYHEVDRMGIVHHPRYFTWFELARLELLRGLGVPYTLLEDQGVGLPLLGCQGRFLKPLVFEQWFRLRCWLEECSRVRFRLGYQILVKDEIHAEASTEHAALLLANKRPTRLPALLLQAFSHLPSQGGDHPMTRASDPLAAGLAPV